MIRAIIRFLVSIWKAIFKLKEDISVENQQEQQQAQQQEQQHLQEHQEHLQSEYNKIDEQHQVNPDPTLQEVENKLNDRF